jgi:hypothetical protein
MTLMRAGSANFICKAVAVLTLFFSSCSVSIAQAATFEESDVKAAFLYYFFHFISWPEHISGSKNQSFEFCMVKNGPVINALELVLASPKAAKTVVRISKISDPEKISGCDYVFIGSASEDYAREIIAATRGRAILTVSDIDGFTSMGGMIELKRNLNRVNVLINLELLKAQGLKASSKLLNLATIISTPQNEDQR